MKLKLAVLAMMFAADPAGAAPGYICMAEQTTGYIFSSKAWNSANFRPDAQAITIQPTGGDDLVARIAGEDRNYKCSRFRFADGTLSTRITCYIALREFVMDTGTLRFQSLYPIGYLDGSDDGEDTPSFTIGRCTKWGE